VADSERKGELTPEQLLERERALFHVLIDAVPDGLFLKDTESRFILANRATAEIMGVHDPELLVGKTDFDFYPSEMAQEFWNDERAVLEGKPVTGKLEPKIVRGVQRWISLTKIPVQDSRGMLIGLVGVSRDVTDRRRDEEKLQEERNLLRTLIDMLPHSVYMKDASCRKTMANRVDVEIIGRSSEAEVLGKTDFDLFAPDVAAAFYRDDTSVIRNGTPVIDREEYYFDTLGKKRWLLTSKVPLRDAQGSVIGLVGVGREITPLKEREAKIREQAQLLDISSDAISVRDEHNCIRYWNKSAEKTYGWSPGEAIGKDEDALLHGRRPDEPKEALRVVMNKGVWVGDLHYITKDGRELTGETRWTLVREEGEGPYSILCVSTDVTERRAIQAQLLRAQRLESLGTLAGGIAHDLNNVLTPIVSGLDVLAPAIQDEKAKQILSTIVRSAQRGANVIRQVLGFARGLEGDLTDVHLKAVLLEVAGIIRETFPKSIDVAVEVPEGVWPIVGSANQLHQVVMNLCVNARDAMPDGGKLSISARNVEVDEAYARVHLGAKAMAYVLVEIEDTGTGMSPEVLDKIFDPFFTTKDPGKGTGLGLSTTLSIVKGHKGFIAVYSEPNKGSSFKVYLPASVRVRDTIAKGTLEEMPRGKGELILVVDDEEAVRETTRWALEQHGYRVITVGDGTEAVAAYVAHREEIRCIITDMMMPHMDGAAIIRTVRRIDPGIKIIATSGLPSNGYVSEARGLGAQGFLAKPYVTGLLLRTVREVLQSD